MHLPILISFFSLFLHIANAFYHSVESFNELKALQEVATKNPRERFSKPNLQRSQTTKPEAPRIFRTKSIPSSKMRADEARRAGLRAIEHKKIVKDLALQEYMRHDLVVPKQDSWKRWRSARDKQSKAEEEMSRLKQEREDLSRHQRRRGWLPSLDLAPGKNRQDTVRVIGDMQEYGMMAKQHADRARQLHRQARENAHAGLGPVDFFSNHLRADQ